MTSRGANVYLQSPQIATIGRQSWTEVLCFKNLKKKTWTYFNLNLTFCVVIYSWRKFLFASINMQEWFNMNQVIVWKSFQQEMDRRVQLYKKYDGSKRWCQFGIFVPTWLKSFLSPLRWCKMSQLPVYVQTHFPPHCSTTRIVIYHLQVSCTWVFQKEQCDLWLSAYYISRYSVLRRIQSAATRG